MTSTPIKNYEEFKELFVREDGKRKNGILLSFLLCRPTRAYFETNGLWRVFLDIKSMAALKEVCLSLVSTTSVGDYKLPILNRMYRHPNFSKSDTEGFCCESESEYHKYRYLKHEEGRNPRPCRQRIGGLNKSIIDSSTFGATLPENVKLWLCEEITHEWIAEGKSRATRYELIVDDNFKEIYSSRNAKGSFGSCMTDDGQWAFYRDSVSAKAARLIDHKSDDKMVARCVIFTQVKDMESGEILRLAERQYSSDGDLILQRILVQKLIEGGHIDGYKRVGADCHNSRAFLGNNEEDWSEREFSIPCCLDYNDTLSYQDSFKWYDMDEYMAYNYYFNGYTHDLAVTDSCLEDERVWDSYHEEYVSEAQNVFVDGCWETCSTDQLEDFIYVQGFGYVHEMEDGLYTCPACGETFFHQGVYGDSCYSDVTEEEYCSSTCMSDAEFEYKRDNGWTWSEYEEEYYEDPSEVVTILFYDSWGTRTTYHKTIHIRNAKHLMRVGCAIMINDEEFVHVNALRHLMNRENV